MKTHQLKCWPEYFEALLNGTKTFEFRQNDRDFKVGDILNLQEYSPTKMSYTGRSLQFKVTYILYGQSIKGINDHYCIMSIEKNRLPMKTIIVPYRNRPQQLQQFIAHVNGCMPLVPIAIIEQLGESKFNRGRLLNIGALEFPSPYYIMHDVDMLPLFDHYAASPFAPVVQFASSKIQLKDYLGGVTMFEHTPFLFAGGYHNDYFHRAEDNEMRFNLHRNGIAVLEKHSQYKMLDHPRHKQEFIASLWQKAQQKRSQQNQLANCVYTVTGREKINDLTTLLQVDF